MFELCLARICKIKVKNIVYRYWFRKSCHKDLKRRMITLIFAYIITNLSNAKLCDVWNSEAYVKKHFARPSKCALEFSPLSRNSQWCHRYLRFTNTAVTLGNAYSKLHDQDSNFVPTKCRSATHQLLHLLCRLQGPCDHQFGCIWLCLTDHELQPETVTRAWIR